MSKYLRITVHLNIKHYVVSNIHAISYFFNRFKERFESQIADAKAVFDHLKLYIGLLVYTALGAWVS